MERRIEPRIDADHPAKITVLGEEPRDCPGRIVNISGNGLRLLMQEAVPAGRLLKIEAGDTLLLGEVCYCEPSGTEFALGLELEHAFQQTEELARLALTLRELSEPEGARKPAPAPVPTRPQRCA